MKKQVLTIFNHTLFANREIDFHQDEVRDFAQQ
jgi:hypothetical protein